MYEYLGLDILFIALSPVLVYLTYPFILDAFKVILRRNMLIDLRHGGGIMTKRHPVKKRTGKRVLLIQGIFPLMDIANCLTRAGFEVASIPNRPETLISLSMFNSDIIVINDAGVSGIVTYHQTRNIFDAPVMLVSGGNLMNAPPKILPEAGADSYISRHLDDEVLVTRVRATLIPCLDIKSDAIAVKTENDKEILRN
jgi:hypothetical protein